MDYDIVLASIVFGVTVKPIRNMTITCLLNVRHGYRKKIKEKEMSSKLAEEEENDIIMVVMFVFLLKSIAVTFIVLFLFKTKTRKNDDVEEF